MCRNAQEAPAIFRKLNICVPVTQLGIAGLYEVFREVAVLIKMSLK